MAIILLIIVVSYGLLWLLSLQTYDVEYGISFNQTHASSLGLDWREVYRAMLDDLQPKYVRVAAMWSEVEKQPNNFTFEDVDFMMDEAQKHGTKVLLVVGQKSPRWPECHVPDWLANYDDQKSEDYLFQYIEKVVERYKDHQALELWQVENEPFIQFKFGDCSHYREELVPKEIGFVKTTDPDHEIVLTDSGELSTWQKASAFGDKFGSTLYRVVRTPHDFIFTYDWLPPIVYVAKARLWGISYSNFFISELQAEPWFQDATPLDVTIARQEETMNPQRLHKNLDYSKHVGASRAYLWGVEWWYWMKITQNDSRYWDIIQDRAMSISE